ncbi:methionyl-tRNA formyltransferase [Mucor ambiguus]|uniref:Methionyl-tRNA formyltransferase, mitochondrial n=1 Tax=Mucor ambiguus TaxID=91626 RepID=A0A0C9M7A8_9FUNG|nr:methionyl-tRNA formyltransferase [Mucor ambiguus]
MLKHFTRHAWKSNRIGIVRFHSAAIANDKLRVLFFGTDNFAKTHLQALIKEKSRNDSCIESIDVVCPPDRRTGRKLEKLTPSETKGVAESHNLNIYHTPPQAKTLKDWCVPSDTNYDVGVVVSFGYFIPPHIIASLKNGAVNVHPSLLPKYRGAAPIQHAIMYGDAETGVTIQELDDREFDAGRILAQEHVSLAQAPPVYSSLKEKLSVIGGHLLVDTIRNLRQRKQDATTQDVSKATKAPKIKKEWSEMDFVNMSAWQAEQLHRAIGEQYPLRTVFEKKNKPLAVQLLLLQVPDAPSAALKGCPPGSFAWDEPSQSLHIVFGDDSVVACTRLKMQNRGAVSAGDFVNGYGPQGQFGVSLDVDDTIIQKNIKKRAKMHRYGAA